MFLALLLQGGVTVKCKIFCKYDLHFSLIFGLNYLQLMFSQILEIHTLMYIVNKGLEMKLLAFSIHSVGLNDLAPKLDVSALLAMISLSVNVVPFPGLRTLLTTLMNAFIS